MVEQQAARMAIFAFVLLAIVAVKLYDVWRALLFEKACAECGRSLARGTYCLVHGHEPEKTWKRVWYAHELLIILAVVGVTGLSKYITRVESPRD